MAIKIKNLEQLKDTTSNKPYFYKDLSLDLSLTKTTDPTNELSFPGIDIKVSFDTQAIVNSLLNLFNTTPGQRMLFPKYGLNLKSFIFSPITATNGKLIGRTIFDKIKLFEPRVTPLFVDVIADAEQHTYEITINIEIPILRQETQLGFVFDVQRQTFFSIPVK